MSVALGLGRVGVHVGFQRELVFTLERLESHPRPPVEEIFLFWPSEPARSSLRPASRSANNPSIEEPQDATLTARQNDEGNDRPT